MRSMVWSSDGCSSDLRFALGGVEVAFGADQEGGGAGMGLERIRQRFAPAFIREEKPASVGPIPQQRVELRHLPQFGKRRAPAFFGRLPQMGVAPVEVELFPQIGRAPGGERVGQYG